jgi:hypothetical protein
MDPNLCNGTWPSPAGHTESEYANIGFCRCGEFCSHATDKPCNVIETTNIKESSSNPKNCMCQTGFCPCGDFVSHRVFEPCNSGEVKKQ